MARQPTRTHRCRSAKLCALWALAALSGSASIAQPPLDGPLLAPPGSAPASGPGLPGYQPAYQAAASAAYPPPAASMPLPPGMPYGGNALSAPMNPAGSLPAGGTFGAPGDQAGRAPLGVSSGTSTNTAVEENVVEVRVEGNRTVATHKIMSQIHTRAGRPYNEQNVQDDVRALTRMGLFIKVEPHFQHVPGGVVIIFRVAERPLIQDVIVIGNDIYKTSSLKKEAEVKAGDAADPFAVENGRRKIEDYYQKHGYSKVRVTVLEGNKTGDLRVIYMVDEGPRQRVSWVYFVGNQFVSAQRLKTQIDSHPPYLYLFSGEYDVKKVNDDVNKLTAYYRSYGFFHARIGRSLEFDENQKWVTITFVIDEGPRYEVHNVSFLGNRRFDNARLAAKLKLTAGQPFDQNQQNLDLMQLRDEYGTEGYVFAKIEPDNRFLDEPGKLDIVYNVEEGKKFRIGMINIEIKGENPHTQIMTVLDRLSIKPGDIANTKEIRNSERRLKAAQLYKVEPMRGIEPKIVYTPPDSDGSMVAGRRQTTYYRLGGDAPLPPLPEDEAYLNIDFTGDPRQPERASTGPASANPPPTYSSDSDGAPRTYQTNSAGWVSPSAEAIQDGPGGPFSHLPRTYQDQPLVAPQLPSRPMLYEVRYQQGDWTAPQPQGGSFPPTRDYTRENDYSAPQAPTNSAGAPPPRYRYVRPGQYDASAQPAPQRVAGVQQQQCGYGEEPFASDSAKFAAGGVPQQQGGYYQRQNDAPLQQAPYYPQQQPAVVPVAYNAPADNPQSNLYSAQSSVPQSGGYGGNSSYTTSPAAPFPPAGSYNPPPNDGTPSGTGPAYNEVSPPSAVSGSAQGGAIYSPSGPAADRSFAPTANGSDLMNDPSTSMFPQPMAPGEPLPSLPIQISPEETQTGRLMFGVGVNSDAGLVGNVTIDEQNFDWSKPPSSWEDVMAGRAWRGAGERFRVELVPGTQVQRYMVTYQDPFLGHQPISFGLSGFYYQRIYTEWTENRVGGSVSLGYQFTHDLTGTFRFQGQDVTISNPEYPVPDLLDVLGRNPMYTFTGSLQHDTRDNQFMATEGHLISASMSETVGAFQYPTASLEFSQFFRIFQRADRSGNHVLNLDLRAGYTGDNTPIFERYYAGGFSSIRGFAFRGVTPRDPVYGMGVGGDFQLLATAQYMFPITADDMLKGVVFVDAGTVEPTITNWNQQVRVAPGFGLRIAIPMMGPAPIALDFAFPINQQPGDVTQIFSFFVGFNH